VTITSHVAICNLALLGHLGQDPITAVGENSRQGELTQIFYDSTRDALLRSHPWNFAVKRSPNLAAAGDVTIPFEYQYAYQLPTDPYCLKVIRTSIEAQGCVHDYRVEGRYIFTDTTGFGIEYIARVTAVGEYDPLFVQLLSFDLAILMCMPLADNGSLKADLIEQRNRLASGAMTIDAQEGAPRDPIDNTAWLYSRF